MQSVTNSSSASKQSAAYLADIADQRKKLEESIEAAGKSGELSDAERAALVKMSKATDALLERYTADGRLSSAEYKRVLQSTQSEKAALEKMIPAANSKPAKTKSQDKAVANQGRTVSAMQSGQAMVEGVLKSVKSYGSMTADQLKNLDALAAKGRSLLTDAMKDGVMTRAEYAKITDAQSAVNRQIRQYQSLPKQAPATSAQAEAQGLDVTV
ncbi:hypothetical protein [Fundidesulfovibrio agrisoli]|uniref:hypothetical protein n=1 Tax=Fundidesulfovibrio agrisoli TaxID=2922717 RepID=UPI001FAD45E2|nr:hypothetical protein [Fundidesulfovibrio agrisoli]